MVILATGLIILGVFCALMGQKVFRIILPIAGFIAGLMVGFSGVQSVFGTGVISTTVAVTTALIVGAMMAVLSFVFYELASTVLIILLGAGAFTYLGLALGLQEQGFLLTLLSIAGAVAGFVYATSTNITIRLIFALTSFVGVAYVLAGVLLLAGELSLDQLSESGVVRAVVDTVDQSFLWLLVWIGASMVAMNIQATIAKREFMDNLYAFKEN